MKRKREEEKLKGNKYPKQQTTKVDFFRNLPEDLLKDLLCFLEIHDLWMIRDVSRHLHKMIYESLKTLDVADISHFKKDSTDLKSLFKKDVIFIYDFIEWNSYLNAPIHCDKRIVLANVRHDGSRLSEADPSLKSDKEIVRIAVKSDGGALEYCSNSLKKDKSIVVDAVSEDPKALRFAHSSIRDCEEIVRIAVKSDGRALEYCSDSFKKDKSIVIDAVSEDPTALRFADSSMCDCEEVVLIALKKDPYVFKYISQRLKDSKNFVLTYLSFSKDISIIIK